MSNAIRKTAKAISLGSAYGASPNRIKQMMEDFYTCNTNVWVTQKGRRLPLKDMTTGHIENSIQAILDGKIKGRRNFLVPLRKELLRRTSKLGEVLYGV